MVELMQRLDLDAHDGHHRPQLGRQLLGHRRLLRTRVPRRPRRLRDGLSLRRRGAHERQAVRGDAGAGTERLVAADPRLAGRDPPAGERGRRPRPAAPFHGRREGPSLQGRREAGRRAPVGAFAARRGAGRFRQRARLPGAECRRHRRRAMGARHAPLHHRRRAPRPDPERPCGRAVLQVRGARRGVDPGRRPTPARGEALRKGPRRRVRVRRGRLPARDQGPHRVEDLLELLGVPVRASGPKPDVGRRARPGLEPPGPAGRPRRQHSRSRVRERCIRARSRSRWSDGAKPERATTYIAKRVGSPRVRTVFPSPWMRCGPGPGGPEGNRSWT